MLEYHHVDVFSKTAFSGNGLTVFPNSGELTAVAMQRITQEMRQFESIFLTKMVNPQTVSARIFTLTNELDFAGHPILGAACVLHEMQQPQKKESVWHIQLPAKVVPVMTTRSAGYYVATMEQGAPTFHQPLHLDETLPLLTALNLSPMNLVENLPLQVVSTGLPYLIVPIKSGLPQARIIRPDFESLLAHVGAHFVYIFDVLQYAGRTWDNDGRIEDIATGSAAGPMAAYLVNHSLEPVSKEITLQQGRFVGRPSKMRVKVDGTPNRMTSVQVSGDISWVGSGVLSKTPCSIDRN